MGVNVHFVFLDANTELQMKRYMGSDSRKDNITNSASNKKIALVSNILSPGKFITLFPFIL